MQSRHVRYQAGYKTPPLETNVIQLSNRSQHPNTSAMFWIIFASVCGIGYAAKLDNTYLPPPPGAQQAGGAGANLQPPLEPPYIDPYSPAPTNTYGNRQPNQYGRGIDFSNINNLQLDPSARRFIENADQIKDVKDSSFDKSKGRFLSGSYSYTGPDNVLVTVTYKADDRQGRKLHEEEEEHTQGYQHDEEDGVVPTPSSLPTELKKAFDFHRKKQQPEDDKKGYKYGKPTPGKDLPEVNQGYSYPQH